jgi:hypothetical protein
MRRIWDWRWFLFVAAVWLGVLVLDAYYSPPVYWAVWGVMLAIEGAFLLAQWHWSGTDWWQLRPSTRGLVFLFASLLAALVIADATRGLWW